VKKKAGLLLLVLIPGLWLIHRVWERVNEQRTTQIGWNSGLHNTTDSVNQIGFRGKTIQPKKDSSEKIILFVGDSQVEANGLPFKFMIENLVQKLLQEKDPLHTYKCYTIGSGGFGQDQEFLALKEYFKKYRADKVLLWFTPENDIWNNIFPTHWPVNANPKPTYWIENGQLKGPNYQWLETYPSPYKPRWKQSFFALKNLDTKWESKLSPPYNPLVSSAYKGVLAPSPIGDEAIEIEKSHYAIFLAPRSKRMEYGIQLARFLLDSIQQVCHANNAAFATFAALNNEVEAMSDSSFSVEKKGKIYMLSKNMFFDNIAAVMQGFDFHLFRLNTEWKQISRQDNHHFNHEAQTEIAHKIVDQILLP
jgi:hypothetical protein